MQKRENNQAKDARSAALTVLLRCERNGAWLDGALKSVLKESALEPRDAALCSKLCYGVCQNRLLLGCAEGGQGILQRRFSRQLTEGLTAEELEICFRCFAVFGENMARLTGRRGSCKEK